MKPKLINSTCYEGCQVAWVQNELCLRLRLHLQVSQTVPPVSHLKWIRAVTTERLICEIWMTHPQLRVSWTIYRPTKYTQVSQEKKFMVNEVKQKMNCCNRIAKSGMKLLKRIRFQRHAYLYTGTEWIIGEVKCWRVKILALLPTSFLLNFILSNLRWKERIKTNKISMESFFIQKRCAW